MSYPKWIRQSILQGPEFSFDKDLTDDERKIIGQASDPLASYIKLSVQKYGYEIPDEEVHRMAQESGRLMLGPLAKTEAEILKRRFRTSLRICGFCQRKDSIITWSHYAANHHGICIEYDAKEFLTNESILKKLHPVIYKEELFDAYPYTTFFGVGAEQNPLLASIAACHKSNEWSYEEEWRLISPVSPENNKPEYNLTYRPKGIFFGRQDS